MPMHRGEPWLAVLCVVSMALVFGMVAKLACMACERLTQRKWR